MKKLFLIACIRHENSKKDSRLYYLIAVGHAYGETQEIRIEASKDFEIETRKKIASSDVAKGKKFNTSIFNRNAKNGTGHATH